MMCALWALCGALLHVWELCSKVWPFGPWLGLAIKRARFGANWAPFVGRALLSYCFYATLLVALRLLVAALPRCLAHYVRYIVITPLIRSAHVAAHIHYVHICSFTTRSARVHY
jgi:hypothetical protein